MTPLPPALNDYLDTGFDTVRGMSSVFSARICAHLIARQTELGIAGALAEIGTFEGRFFIAMGLAARSDEPLLAIDTFDWPDDGIRRRFTENCVRHGLAEERVTVWQGNTAQLDEPAFGALLSGRSCRFVHIDGDHSEPALAHDLALAASSLHPQGIICLDDMLHPSYPFLVVTVAAFLTANPQFKLFLIIDREDIVAAPKFLICRDEAVRLYEADLMERFSAFHFLLGGDALGHHCVVLTPQPRLAEVSPG